MAKANTADVVQDYFGELAAMVTNALATTSKGKPSPLVSDNPQEPAQSTWACLAVHPMNVMETGYVKAVEDAVALVEGDDEKLEAAAQVLSQYFALNSGPPSLLSPTSGLLTSDWAKATLGAKEAAKLHLDQKSNDELYDALLSIVDYASAYLNEIIPTTGAVHVSDNVNTIYTYLKYANHPYPNTTTNWKNNNLKGDLDTNKNYLIEIERNITKQITDPWVSAASPRSIYNIAPFYLFRLMHRFVGGTAEIPMVLATKREASGIATKALNRPDKGWNTVWLQNQVVALDTEVKRLDIALQEKFQLRGIEVLRFHLKGGRALFTALGSPEKGTNDWDTGIMINPDLPANEWYQAFGAVNDMVVKFLDKVRFGYSSLLLENSNSLDPTLPQQPLGGTAKVDADAITDDGTEGEANFDAEDDYDSGPESEYSRLAFQADRAEDLLYGKRLNAAQASGLGGKTAKETLYRPTGVNGELIDIGIAVRNSAELREHWRTIKINGKLGARPLPSDPEVYVPVPDLPYFVEDLTLIIRESLGAPEISSKFGKRLVRTAIVMTSGEATINARILESYNLIRVNLPKTFAKLDSTGQGAVANQMYAWCLANIIESMAVYFLYPDWLKALDEYLSVDFETMMNPAQSVSIWDKVRAKIPDDEKFNSQAVLVGQYAGYMAATKVITQFEATADTYVLAANQAMSKVLSGIEVENATVGTDRYYKTGFFALADQVKHAELNYPNGAFARMGGAAQMYFKPGNKQPMSAFSALAQRVRGGLPIGYSINVEEIEGQVSCVLSRRVSLGGLDHSVAILVIQPDPGEGSSSARILDSIDGQWVASVRDLERQFVDRAGHSDDPSFRGASIKAGKFALENVLGRQLQV